jgi:hypothetical protein
LLDNYKSTLLQLEEEYHSCQKELDAIDEKKAVLNAKFYQKYIRFIQEGTWNSNNYTDPELYYLDA